MCQLEETMKNAKVEGPQRAPPRVKHRNLPCIITDLIGYVAVR